jgi:hypothetical protein
MSIYESVSNVGVRFQFDTKYVDTATPTDPNHPLVYGLYGADAFVVGLRLSSMTVAVAMGTTAWTVEVWVAPDDGAAAAALFLTTQAIPVSEYTIHVPWSPNCLISKCTPST